MTRKIADPYYEKSKIPHRIGLTLLILGIMYALSSLLFGFYNLCLNDPAIIYAKKIPNYLKLENVKTIFESQVFLQNITGIKNIVVGLISALAIISGFWLVQYISLGKKFARIWVFCAFLFIILDIVTNFFIIIPVNQTIADVIPAAIEQLKPTLTEPERLFRTTHVIKPFTIFIKALFFSIVPVLTIIFVFPKKIDSSFVDKQ